MLAASPSMVLRSNFRRGFAVDASSADNETDCMVIDVLLLELSAGRDLRVPSTLPFIGKTGAPAPVGPRRERAGLGRCGLRGRPGCGRGGSPLGPWGLRRTRPCRSNRRRAEGREGGALPEPCFTPKTREPAAHAVTNLRNGSSPHGPRPLHYPRRGLGAKPRAGSGGTPDAPPLPPRVYHFALEFQALGCHLKADTEADFQAATGAP